jgi:6-phosphogluconolactonase
MPCFSTSPPTCQYSSEQYIKQHGVFRIALSGGSMPSTLGSCLTSSEFKDCIEWDKWIVFFADERYVALDHKDSNYGLCQEHLFKHVGIRDENIIKIDATKSLDEAAADYEARLRKHVGNDVSNSTPVLDVVMLGMGPDGHTASLFPNHSLLSEQKLLVAPINDSPKPPPQRITFTLPLINAANEATFLLSGSSKVEKVTSMLDKNQTRSHAVPCSLINAKQTHVFLDATATPDSLKN